MSIAQINSRDGRFHNPIDGSVINSNALFGEPRKVTQATSNATGVTLSATCGEITMFGTLALSTGAQFVLTNTRIGANSIILLSAESRSLVTFIPTLVSCISVAAGSCTINVYNSDGSNATAAAPIIHFAVLNPREF